MSKVKKIKKRPLHKKPLNLKDDLKTVLVGLFFKWPASLALKTQKSSQFVSTSLNIGITHKGLGAGVV